MKAIVLDDSRPDRPLVYRDVPEPVPGDTELLVAVHAAGTSRADLRRTATHFAASDTTPASMITGLEFAGEVVKTGREVGRFKVGDRVMAFAGGANAEYALVDQRYAMPVPSCLSWVQAAAIPISFLTAHNAVADAARFAAGESILIQGGSSSVGMAAIQIARLKNAKLILGTASTAEKLAHIRKLGCDVAINYRNDDVAAVVNEKTAGGANVVIDLIGGPTAQSNIDSVAIQGRIICVGRIEDRATLNLNEFSRKRIQMIGVTFRTRTPDERAAVIRHFCEDLIPEFEKGIIFPQVDQVFPLIEAEAALSHIRNHGSIGKVVLRVRA